MIKFIERLFGRREPSSGEVAKERLRLVLTQDRAGISPALLETLKDEIIMVISRHVDVDVDGVQVTVTQSGRGGNSGGKGGSQRESSLIADIPLTTRTTKRQPGGKRDSQDSEPKGR